MTLHLSSLELDEIAAGLSSAPPHLAQCQACSTQLKALKQQAHSFEFHPRAQAQREGLAAQARQPGHPERSAAESSGPRLPSGRTGAAARDEHRTPWPRRAVLILVPLAAALALLLGWPGTPSSPQSRVKGGPSLALRNAAGDSVTQASPGDQLMLTVGGGDFRFARVVATEADGTSTQLWPPQGKHYGLLPQGPAVPLRALVVTPGDVLLTASFAREELELEAVGEQSVQLRLVVR